MITDLNISIAEKLTRIKPQNFPEPGLIMTRVDIIDHLFPYLVRTRLAETEKKRLNSLKNRKRRREWLAGRIAAKEAIFKMAGEKKGFPPALRGYQSIAVERTPAGRPWIVSGSEKHRDLSISISHSHGLAVAMASTTPCGVDIQKVDRALERIKDYFVNRAEIKILNDSGTSLYSPRQKLALLWSAKEALKKQSRRKSLPGFHDLELLDARTNGVQVFTLALPHHTPGGQALGRVAAVIYGSYSLAWTID